MRNRYSITLPTELLEQLKAKAGFVPVATYITELCRRDVNMPVPSVPTTTVTATTIPTTKPTVTVPVVVQTVTKPPVKVFAPGSGAPRSENRLGLTPDALKAMTNEQIAAHVKETDVRKLGEHDADMLIRTRTAKAHLKEQRDLLNLPT